MPCALPKDPGHVPTDGVARGWGGQQIGWRESADQMPAFQCHSDIRT